MPFLIALPAFLIILILGLIWDGFVLSTIWNWFMTQVFDLKYLSFAEALAVCMTALAFTGKYKVNVEELSKTHPDHDPDDRPTAVAKMAISLFGNLISGSIVLGVAWLLKGAL